MPTYKIIINERWPDDGRMTILDDVFEDKDLAWKFLKEKVEKDFYWASLSYNEGYSICSWENPGPYSYMNIGEIQTIYSEYEVLYNTYMDNINTIKELEKENSSLALKIVGELKKNAK